jgi:hypothetical protein
MSTYSRRVSDAGVEITVRPNHSAKQARENVLF